MTEEEMTQELLVFCKEYHACGNCPIEGVCFPDLLFPSLDVRAVRLNDMYHAMKSYQKQQEGEK